MMPPDTQPVSVVSCSFRQQQSSKQWHVVRSGHVNGQLSHQQKQGCNLQQQCSQWGSFSWQQSSQSPHVSPHPQPLSPHAAHPPLEHDGVALQLASFDAVELQLPLFDEGEGAGAALVSPMPLGGVGAGGCAAV
jgi:hypothetical protein